MEYLKLLCITFILILIQNECGAQLPCNSRLRILRPQLFTHCGCRHTKWTDWKQVPNSIGPSTECTSGKAYQEIRYRYSVGGDCADKNETRSICVPTRIERLAILLGLGRADLDTSEPQGSPNNHFASYVYYAHPHFPAYYDRETEYTDRETAAPPKARRQVSSQGRRCNEGAICGEYTEQRARGKRTLPRGLPQENVAQVNHDNPIPFILKESGHRFKRQVNKCNPGDKQHVLFVLDTSGSIGRQNFKEMTKAVADLTALFCSNISVAVITFNHKFHLEFCFNCFGNDDSGRYKAYRAIKNIHYRSGWTHTGGAAKCICNKLLNESCGIEFADHTCVDVIFITDGASNDPSLEICDEVKCLHDHDLKLNTYTLGIGGYNNRRYEEELKCIQSSDNDMSMFWFESFAEFSEAIKDLYKSDLNGKACWGAEQH